MYSVVLLTAMTASAPEAPNFFPYLRFTGGCWGSCAGCWGTGYGPWWAVRRVSFGADYGWCTGSGYWAGYTVYGPSRVVYSSPALWGANYTYTHSYPGQPPVNIPGSLAEPLGPPRKTGSQPSDTSARLAIDLPANARLYVDGQLVPGTGERRHFFTPPLETGASYYYDVKVEISVDGKTDSDVRKITVKAGEQKSESFVHVGTPARLAAATK